MSFIPAVLNTAQHTGHYVLYASTKWQGNKIEQLKVTRQKTDGELSGTWILNEEEK